LLTVKAIAQVPTWEEEGTLVFEENFGAGPTNFVLTGSHGGTECKSMVISEDYLINHSFTNDFSYACNTWEGWDPDLTDDTYIIAKETWSSPYNPSVPDKTGLVDGYYMIAKPDKKRVVYSHQINNVCPSTTLSFTAWLMNAMLFNEGWGPPSQNFIFRIKNAANTNNEIATYTTEKILPNQTDWKQYGFEFKVPDDVTSIIISIETNNSGFWNTFCLDDIEVRLKTPVAITSPEDNNIDATNGAIIRFEGGLNCTHTLGNDLISRWENKQDGSEWESIDETNNSSNTGTITNFYNATGSDETVSYRLAVTKAADINYNDAIYSDTITINYSFYLLKEDFGGNTESTSSTGDWWIMAGDGQHPAFGYDMLDNGGYPYGYADNGGTYLPDYGQNKIDIWEGRYGLTKVTYPLGNSSIVMDDHTFSGDSTMGYFMWIRPVGNNNDNNYTGNEIFYRASINASLITPGNEYVFRGWFVNLNDNIWAISTTKLTLQVEKENGTVIATQDITFTSESGKWEQFSLPFVAPDAGNYVVKVINANDWTSASQFGVDDIEVSIFTPSSTIESPENGSEISFNEDATITAKYEVNYTSSIYKWQYKATEDGTWIDINGASGTLTNVTGEITYTISSFTPSNIGFYRVLVTRSADTDYSDAIPTTEIKLNILNSVNITQPTASEVNVLKGYPVPIEGIYALGGSGTSTIKLQKSQNGSTWSDAGTSATGGNSGTIDLKTDNITEDIIYYRIKVELGETTIFSDAVKMTSVALAGEITYWICPDNMTDSEARSPKGGENAYLPGQKGLPGYLPSLINLEVEELYGIRYEWYYVDPSEVAHLLEDGDYYEPNVTFPTIEAIDEPAILSDGKDNTLSVQNERNTEGEFTARSYRVKVYNADGYVTELERKMLKSYLCGSTVPKLSPEIAKQIHRESYGGTDQGAPVVSPDALDGMTYDHQTNYGPSHPSVDPGAYVVTKKLEGQHNVEEDEGGWYKGTQDHIYDNYQKLPSEKDHGYFVAINGNENPGQFYSYALNDISHCQDVDLFFSAWLASPLNWGGSDKANLKFTLKDENGNLLSEFITGNLIDADGVEDADGVKKARWRQYAFRFPVPADLNNLTFAVASNSLGTSSGNDILIDDIEIYLLISPVKIDPTGKDYICGEEEEYALRGTFEDTELTTRPILGDNLDYRWEFLKDGTTVWQPVGNIGNTTNGSIEDTYTIDHFTEENNGYYRLVVGKAPAFNGSVDYFCMGISEPVYLTLASSVFETFDPLLDGQTAFCYDSKDNNTTVTSTEQNTKVDKYKEYTWLLDGVPVKSSDNSYDGNTNLEYTFELTSLKPGDHTIDLILYNEADCDLTVRHKFLVFPRAAIWTAAGGDNDWNNAENWDTKVVPGECTNVIVPDKYADNEGGMPTKVEPYPFLMQPTVETLNGKEYAVNQENLDKHLGNDLNFYLRPACDTILFEMGGAVARTNYLKYEKAFVNLEMDSARWYMISAPLRDMYSGDYFVNGSIKRKPIVYMMQYNTINPQTNDVAAATGGFTNPFNTLEYSLYPGLGFAVWTEADSDPVNKDITPSFKFPKDSTEYAMWTYSGEYVRMVPDLIRENIGRFTYESRITMNGNLPAANQSEFTVEVKGDDASYTTTMVGNPFMSHLSFSEFADVNKNELTGSGYYIWEGESGVYHAFNPELLTTDPNEIPPMQSFIVNKEGKLITEFTFTMAMAVPSPAPTSEGAVLRSSIVEENRLLRLEAVRDNVIQSNIRLKYDPAERNSYDPRKDMWTLFSEDIKTPAVLYALLNGKAASIRTIGNLTEAIELGIRTTEKGELTLRLSDREAFDTSCYLYLEDRLLGLIQDLRKTPEYTFDNQTGNVEGRFFLKISEDPIEVDANDNSSISLRRENRKIRIESSVNDPIQMITVYSVQGKLLYRRNTINAPVCEVDLPSEEHVFIVSVVTERTRRNEKIIVK